jgi:hypothetical protein
MRKALLLVLVTAMLAGLACRRDAGPGPAAADGGSAAVAAAPAVDRAMDERFAFAAGLAPESPSYAALREEIPWKDYAALAGKAWEDFGSAVLRPMEAWADNVLWEAREYTSALFYPFGGPDFATASTLFPGASTTVLLGLEPIGNLPDLGRVSPEWRAAFLADLGELVTGFLKRGYFVTDDMNDIYGRGKVDGALPVIVFFLKRGGCSIVGVKRLLPDAAGGWTETPYERLAKRPRRPYGVRIDYVVPGEASTKSVYYFSCDLENAAFTEESALHKFFQELGTLTTFVKSGSYLLHWGNFSNVRKLILERSRFVLQDDTAIPFRFFKRSGWEVRLYGRYATPVKDFINVEQKDLREAYEEPGAEVRPLPFHFGYRWRTQVDNLLLAKRPRRPYKVPVVK